MNTIFSTTDAAMLKLMIMSYMSSLSEEECNRIQSKINEVSDCIKDNSRMEKILVLCSLITDLSLES